MLLRTCLERMREYRMVSLPLSGVRVADFSRVLTGPYCTQTLGDLGASVVKVEPPGGDDTRAWGPPFAHGQATYFQSCNRNKRSLELNLKDLADLAVARKLIQKSDVLVENFRPGTLEKLGLDPVQLRLEQPRLIVCRITGFGSHGALTDWAGYDVIAQGMSGFMTYTGEPDGEPMKAGVAVADVFAGALACQGILAALFEREKTGVGRTVEVNLLEAMLALGTYQVSRSLGAGEDAERLGNAHRSIVPYGLFKTKDGHINIAGGNDKLFQAIGRALEIEAFSAEHLARNDSRITHRAEVNARLEAALSRFSSDEAVILLQAAGVPCGPVWGVGQALESEFASSRQIVTTTPGSSVRFTTPPFEFDGERLPVRLPPPELNAHGAEIRAELEE
jgi:crotonobetainyl-CoA:carnitine CoA-transferase CaiB-like acyl-CoA transferase